MKSNLLECIDDQIRFSTSWHAKLSLTLNKNQCSMIFAETFTQHPSMHQNLPNMEGVVCKTAKSQRKDPSTKRIILLASHFSKASTTYLMIIGKVRSTFKKWMWFKGRCQPEPNCPLIAALGDDAATAVAAPPHPSLAAGDATRTTAPRCSCPFHRPGVATPADCHPTLILVEWAPRRTTKIHDAEAWSYSLHLNNTQNFSSVHFK